MANIIKQISNYNYSSRNGKTVTYLVIHDVGVKGQTAKDNAEYFGTGDRNSSAHYFVDRNSIYQVVEETNSSWHCGDGNGAYGITNQNSIGIELIVENDGIIHEETIGRSLSLIKEVQDRYGIPIERVVRHYDASRKNCPAHLNLDSNWTGWTEFKKRVAGTSGVSIASSRSTYPPRTGYTQEQIDNVKIITEYFTKKGWHIAAIAGLLGNMEQESYIKPDISEYGSARGYGLVQWTCSYDLTMLGVQYVQILLKQADITGDYRNIYTQLDLLNWHLYNNGQYISNSQYPYSAIEFTQLADPRLAARVFEMNFERPGDSHPERADMASDWYAYLTGNGSTSGDTTGDGATTYTVKSGDTLSAIALKYGVTVSQLMQWNGISNADQIQIGQVLKVTGNNNVTGLQRIDDNTYYFDTDGTMKTGWTQIGTEYYYFNKGSEVGELKGAAVTGLSTIANNSGIQRIYYFDSSGKMVFGWKQIGTSYYYFGKDGTLGNSLGAVYTGLIEMKDNNGTTRNYYFNTEGKMVSGWSQIGTAYYYFGKTGTLGTSLGAASTGLKTNLDGYTYYFSSDGKLSSGWQVIDGNTYYFQKTGTVGSTLGASVTGLKKIDSYNYYFEPDGTMKTGWTQIGTEYYYFNKGGDVGDLKGAAVTGLSTIANNSGIQRSYYFDSSGKMVFGWKQIGTSYYYFGKDGTLGNSLGAAYTGLIEMKDNNGTTRNYYFNTEGKMVSGWSQIGTAYYYFGKTGTLGTSLGAASTGLKTNLDGYTYCFSSDGKLSSGWRVIDGNTYYFQKTGTMGSTLGASVTGLKKIDSYNYYFETDGTMKSGWTQIGTEYYHFNKSGEVGELKGAAVTGLSTIANNSGIQRTYYFDSSGKMAFEWQQVGTGYYYLGKDGTLGNSLGSAYTGLIQMNGYTYYFNSDGKMFSGDKTVNGIDYYFRKNGTLGTTLGAAL